MNFHKGTFFVKRFKKILEETQKSGSVGENPPPD